MFRLNTCPPFLSFLPPRGLVKLTIILSDLDDFEEMNAAYGDFLASRGCAARPPARTTFQAGGKMPRNAKLVTCFSSDLARFSIWELRFLICFGISYLGNFVSNQELNNLHASTWSRFAAHVFSGIGPTLTFLEKFPCISLWAPTTQHFKSIIFIEAAP